MDALRTFAAASRVVLSVNDRVRCCCRVEVVVAMALSCGGWRCVGCKLMALVGIGVRRLALQLRCV